MRSDKDLFLSNADSCHNNIMPYSDPNITAEVVCDSVNPNFKYCRLTTMVLTYPRIILAELNTHRMFSRSTASSRAIPIQKQIQNVITNPFRPSWLGKAQAGMQANEEIDDERKERFLLEWKMASRAMTNVADVLERMGIHKQIPNRLLEPFTYVTTIVTATDWNNFFKLRCSPMAQPEFMVLAYRMLQAYVDSTPVSREDHIPFFGEVGVDHGFTNEQKRKIAVARCARVSYKQHDGTIDPQKDIALYDRLLKDKHMSPFEHVAFANLSSDVYTGNFRGWIQERKRIHGEVTNQVNHQKLLDTKPDWV